MEQTFTLNLDPLIEQINSSVEQAVKQYIDSQFDEVISQISTHFNLDKTEVLNSINTKYSIDTSKLKQKKELHIDEKNCTGLTKAGLPCRYKLIPGGTTCKKHKLLNENTKQPLTVNDLPSDEQQWFNTKQEYRASFFPKYEHTPISMDDEIVDDETYVTNE